MSDDSFDAIVVGAGPAGSACAYTLAKAGKNVLLLERGDSAGAKNVSGGRLYTYALELLEPGMYLRAPLGRRIVRDQVMMIDGPRATTLDVADFGWGEGIPQSHSVVRATLDEWFAAEAIPPESRRVARTVDMRYAGQNYELPIPMLEGEIEATTLDVLAARFAEAHQRMYGFTAAEDPVQMVTFRVEASGLVPKAHFAAGEDAGPDASGAVVGTRSVWLPEAGGFVDCPVYARDRLRAGNRFSGPAVIEQMDATTVVLPEMVATVEPYMNLVLEVT